jgi:hypothetical protein
VDPVSFDPDSDAGERADTGTEEANQLLDTMKKILKVLLRLELHAKSITEEEFTDDDVD